VTQFLTAMRPFIQTVSLLFALLAAIKGLQDLVPALSFIHISGTAQGYAIIAGGIGIAAWGGGRG